jgi:hypothetical protein
MTETDIVYYSNGLYLKSVIHFPELQTSTNSPDVTITFGKIPDVLKEANYSDDFQQINLQDYQLNMPSIAKFLVKNTNEVIIEAYPNSDEADIRMYFLASILPVLVHKHKLLPLHSCCINVNGNAFLIGGVSGAGKSTFALGMHRKGYEILNDDVSTIGFNEKDNPIAYIGYRQIKLLTESLENYGYELTEFEKLNTEITKFRFPLQEEILHESLPIKAVFLFEHDPQKEVVDIQELKGLESFLQLTKNTFRVELLRELGLKKNHFELCSKIAQKIKVFKVSRPQNMGAEEFSTYMEKLFLTY